MIADWGQGLLRVNPDTDVIEEPNRDFLWLGAGAAIEVEPFQVPPVLQLLALYAGVRRGRDVDAPTGLRKAVTDD